MTIDENFRSMKRWLWVLGICAGIKLVLALCELTILLLRYVID